MTSSFRLPFLVNARSNRFATTSVLAGWKLKQRWRFFVTILADISLSKSSGLSSPFSAPWAVVGQYVVRTIQGAALRFFTSELQFSKDPVHDILSVSVVRRASSSDSMNYLSHVQKAPSSVVTGRNPAMVRYASSGPSTPDLLPIGNPKESSAHGSVQWRQQWVWMLNMFSFGFVILLRSSRKDFKWWKKFVSAGRNWNTNFFFFFFFYEQALGIRYPAQEESGATMLSFSDDV